MVEWTHSNLSCDFFVGVLVSGWQKVNSKSPNCRSTFCASGCWRLWLLLSILSENGKCFQHWPVGGEAVKLSSLARGCVEFPPSSHSLRYFVINCMWTWTRSGGRSHPFVLRRSLSLSSSRSTDGVCFVGHDLIRPRRSRLLVTGEVTLGHCAAVNFGQRDCFEHRSEFINRFGDYKMKKIITK